MRRIVLAITLLALAGGAHAAQKVLRYAFEIAETSFDPQRISDVYSNIVNQSMFESPLTYDYLARPAKLKPNVATTMPEVSADGTTYTLRIKPGIYFADDPAFGGKKRELVAADFVYAIKRVLDPRVRASLIAEIEPYVVGADHAAETARKKGKLDYDAPIEGLKVVDKYTFQVKIKQPMYVFIYKFADCRIACAVAREVAEKYGDDIGAHPVGTGPFRLAFWKRSSKMVFERNPNYHEDRWDAQIPAGDPRTEEFERMRGKRLPMIDRVEVSVIEETQPRWLSFLNEEMDLIFLVPDEFAYQAFPNNKLAKNLERRGIRMEQFATLDVTYAFYNMEDPVFGGYTPDKVALRRAINLSYKIKGRDRDPAQGPGRRRGGPLRAGRRRIRSQLPHCRQRVQPVESQGAAGHVRVHGPGRRRLPRDARRLTAHAAPPFRAELA
jgi:ABC-type transport system substrate-binding protein